LAVLAVQQIRRMRGGAQGQLMLGADGQVYVVKFQNNPQHMRVLANELLASRLAAAAGLTVPETESGGGIELADREHAGAGDRHGTDATRAASRDCSLGRASPGD
jgi:hypothetical protein